MSLPYTVYTQEKPLVVFKWVRQSGSAPWGNGDWDLPKGCQRGAIRSIGDRLLPKHCVRGIHGYNSVLQLVEGAQRSHRLFVAEIWGKVVTWHNKVAGQHGCLCYEVELIKGLAWHQVNEMYWSARNARKDKYAPFSDEEKLLVCAVIGKLIRKSDIKV